MNEVTQAAPARILVVDDDPAIRRVILDRFAAQGYALDSAKDGNQALNKIESFQPDLVLLDVRMPGKDGLQVLEELQDRDERPAVVVITAHGSIETAVRAVRLGALDFIAKPFDPAHLSHVVERTLSTEQLKHRLEQLETEVSERHTMIADKSEATQRAISLADRAAGSQSTVLLLGESGSGKEVLARYLHARSPRRHGPFIAVNCATLSAELLESELFGHEKGAFTGAVRSKPGRIEQAAGGTLFLDEIGELAPSIQAKLLRVLQEREFERVGGARTIKADVRVVAATHRDLPAAIEAGSFREDLYYRINVVSIRVPPLRQRPEDLPALIQHFLKRHSRDSGRAGVTLSDEAQRLLCRYSWPGNIRELSNVIERAVVLAESSTISIEDLPEEIRDAAPRTPSAPFEAATGEIVGFHEAVRESKRAILRRALDQSPTQTQAAKMLGLTQPYLARLMKNLDVKKK